MDLPKYGRSNPGRFFNQFARDQAGKHANQHFPNMSRIWRPKRDKTNAGASFDLSGPCQGDLAEVVALGLSLAQSALEANNADLAERIIARIESVKIEYEIAEREHELELIGRQYEKIAEARSYMLKRK